MIRLPPKNVEQYHVVDHLFEGEPVQSVSVKPFTLRCLFDLYNTQDQELSSNIE